MKQGKLLILILVAMFNLQEQAYTQVQTSHWYFGSNAGLDFTTGSPVLDIDGQISTIEGSTSISDEYGNLLFYTDGRRVYDSTHNIMINGTGLRGDASSTSSAIVLPKPDDCNLYYVFTIDLDADRVPTWRPQRGIEYNIIDMSLNGGLGAVVEKNISVPINGVVQGYEKLAAISNADKTGYWIVTHFEGDFYAFEITSEGVNLNPVVSTSSIFGGVNNIGYLKGSPDGSKLGMGMSFVPSDEDKYLSVYDFDNLTGVVSNEQTIHYPGFLSDGFYYHFYGIEFSPNSELLYTTVRKISSSGSLDEECEIWQLNLNASDIVASKFVFGSGGSCYGGALQLGLDGKIYVNTYEDTANNHFLGRIENPNIAYNDLTGEFPIFTPEFIDFGNASTGIGLPTFLNHYFRITITVNELSVQENQLYCTGELLNFDFCHQGGEIQDINWDFGDGNTTNEFYPEYAYNTTGTHTITLTLTVDGEEFIRTFDITITGPQDIEDAFLSSCDIGEEQTFNLSEALQQINPNNTDTEITFHETENEAHNKQDPIANITTIENNTIVYVRAEDENGCYVIRQLELVIHPLPLLDVQTPVETCYGTIANLNANVNTGMLYWYASENDTIPVSTGNSFTTPELTMTSSFWVEAIDENGCVSERLEVRVIVPTEDIPSFTINQIFCLNGEADPLPTISDNGISGSWSPAIVDTSVLGTQTHVFTADTNECGGSLQISMEFDVLDIVTPEFNIATEYLLGEMPHPLPEEALNGINGTWYPSDIINSGTYLFVPNTGQCAEEISVDIKVMTYPKFFTPNNDGNNDYWNIGGFSEEHQAKVLIYDRYGKIIESFNAPGAGWDGTYNGNKMPTNDYWFKVDYKVENQEGTYISKVYRSHFTLKR